MSSIINFALRGAQLVFAAVVLGLSVTLAKGQVYGSAPAPLGYAAFVGAFSLLAGFAGIASSFVEFLQGPIILGLDALIFLINAAGGIVLAVKIRGVDCTKKNDYNAIKLFLKDIVRGGCAGKGKNEVCGYYPKQGQGYDTLFSRCQEIQADSAFLFLTCVIAIAALVLGFLHHRK